MEVQGSWRVEVPELSALALRFREDTHSGELLGVGDRSFKIFAGAAEPPGETTVTSDLSDSVSRWTLEPGFSLREPRYVKNL